MNKIESLTPQVKAIVLSKGTEYCNTGLYNDFSKDGTYLCRCCGIALFNSHAKFSSGTGWPSFDKALGNVKKTIDQDGTRMEVVCDKCDSHLGHVFTGEGFTTNNIRYCINSLALDFVPYVGIVDTEEAILAAGCFWGVEYLLKKLPGVLKTEVGYTGGTIDNPTYDKVYNSETGYVEAIRVVFDPNIIAYTKVIEFFFEIHDFSQETGQGPDIGSQYLSKVFYYNDEQQKQAHLIIERLQQMSCKVATKLLPVNIFWPAEEYHQEYYSKNNGTPYCHIRRPIF